MVQIAPSGEESFNQKKDLLFLRDKTKEQLKDYQHLLTDTQKKWLLQLEESDWDWENFVSRCSNTTESTPPLRAITKRSPDWICSPRL